MSERNVRLDHLLGTYRVGSGDWPWCEEYDNLIDQPDTQKLLARIRTEGIREPVLLGTDGRIWDGHHRIVIAMHLGLDSVPVEFAGEGGTLNALISEKRAEWEVEQGEPEWEYRCTGPDGETPRRFATESEVAWHMKSGCGEMQRRKAGLWLPVTNTESENKP